MICARIALAMLLIGLFGLSVMAQDRATGGIKGKVRVETGSPSGVAVIVRRGERVISQTTTNKNGDFLVQQLTPGTYAVTLRKPGLSVGTIEDVEVKPGKTRSLGDRLILTIDEGSIAFIRGSVFTAAGRSVPNAKIELAQVFDDGTAKKIDGRITNETGSFVFRLPPEAATYRVTLKSGSPEPISKDVEIDGAAVYRIAISLPPKD